MDYEQEMKLSRIHPLKDPIAYREALDEYDKYRSTLPDLYNDDCLATPLVEVLSVSVYVDDDNKPSQVYGTIQVIDGDGAIFDLYNREENEEETVLSKGGSLTLTLPKGRAMSPLNQVVVELSIKDKARDSAAIAKGLLIWDYRTKDNYDQVQTENVYGECGCAAIRYITYSYAVIANVDVAIGRVLKPGVKSPAVEVEVDVFGKIVARCDNYVTNTSCSSTLFEKKQDQSIRVKTNNPISLSRHVIAVPAHSWLVIKADLWNDGTPLEVRSKAVDYSIDCRHEVQGKNGNLIVTLRWSMLYLHYLPQRNLMEEASDEENTDGERKWKEIERSSGCVPSPLSESDVSSSGNSSPRSIEPLDFVLMEVFSVVVGSNKESNAGGFDLSGTIEVRHGGGLISFIYLRDKTSAERLHRNHSAITTIGPFDDLGCLRARSMLLRVNFKDGEGHQICGGCLPWGPRRRDAMPLCIDNHLCSVIVGDSGYAAVHYAIFSSAMQATVKVRFVPSSPTNRFQVHGSIFTEYSKYTYETPYDKANCRSKLFQRRSENPLLLLSSTSSDEEFLEVPLLKTVVAVPLDSSLIVDLHLRVSWNDNDFTESETFRGRLDFDGHSEECNQCLSLKGKSDQRIDVYVDWSELSLPAHVFHPSYLASLCV